MRYSIHQPRKYIETNILGFFNIVDACKTYKVKRLFFASSSSVYGNSKKFPLKENFTLKPTNTYSLSKKFNEDIAETFCNHYSLKCTGLRFFTIFGHWGRPDMFIPKLIHCCIKKKSLH